MSKVQRARCAHIPWRTHWFSVAITAAPTELQLEKLMKIWKEAQEGSLLSSEDDSQPVVQCSLEAQEWLTPASSMKVNQNSSSFWFGTSCPEKLWRPRPWKRSRPGWTGLLATWSSWRGPCSLQGGSARWPIKVPSNPKRSMIHESH